VQGSTRLRIAMLLAAGAVAAGGATAAPAGAGLGVACPNPTAHVFAPWGDGSNYTNAPNGGLESGATGWTLSGGAKVVPGNESFAVGSASDAHSLSLPAGSSATTAPMCVSLLSGHMRFFASNAGSASSRLRVQVVYGGGVGGLLGGAGALLGLSDVGSVASGQDWQPSPVVGMLGGVLPLLTQSVQFRFTPADGSGSWRIDDVYLDPLMHG